MWKNTMLDFLNKKTTKVGKKKKTTKNKWRLLDSLNVWGNDLNPKQICKNKQNDQIQNMGRQKLLGWKIQAAIFYKK